MKRRNFFGKLGIGIVSTIALPKILANDPIDEIQLTDGKYELFKPFSYDEDTTRALRNGGWYEKYEKLDNGLIYTDTSIYEEAKMFHMENPMAIIYPFPIIAVSKNWNYPKKAWLEIQVDDITPEYMELAKKGAPNVYDLIKWNEENS